MASRAQAALRNLQIRLMESLPFIADLQAPRDLLELLLEDFQRKQAYEATEKSLNTQLSKDTKAGYAGSESEATTKLREVVKKAKESLQEAEEAATKALDKHYRVMSRTLHPDRSGEDTHEAFTRLTRAKDCLRETQKRRLYLDQMLQVAQISPSLIEKSHDTWVARNFPDQEPMPTTKKHAPSTLFLKGGIVNDTPRKAYVSILNNKKRCVSIVLPLKPNFCEYCVKIVVLAQSADYDKGDYTCCTVGKSVIEKYAEDDADREISLKGILPVSGIWDIRWYGTLIINGQKVDTPHSYEARVDLTSEEQRRRRVAIISTDELAKVRAGDIHSCLQKLRGARPDHLEIERRCDLLHEVVARGRSTLNRLLDLLRADGASESSVKNLVELRQALQMAGPAKQHLEEQFALSAKKDALKSFKRYVAGLLEAGEAASWLRSVEEDDLRAKGGETNRLYQLLVEGKGESFTLALDAVTLEAASGRTDLFTSKQCDTLNKRRIEADEQEKHAAEEAMAKKKAEKEQEKKMAAQVAELRRKQAEEEAQRKALEARQEAERQAYLKKIRSEKAMLDDPDYIPPNTLVEISGLKSKEGVKLNGTTGIVQYKEEDRFVVTCTLDGKQRKLLRSKLYVPNKDVMKDVTVESNAASSWSCSVCTLLHEGPRANASKCDACGTPRGTKAVETHAATASAFEAPTGKQQDTKPKDNGGSPGPVERQASKKQPCFHGAECRYIRSGQECKFYHSPEEIARALADNNEHIIYITHSDVGNLIGPRGSHMKEMVSKSGAHIKIRDEKTNVPTVHITGNQKSVNAAIQEIKKRLGRPVNVKANGAAPVTGTAKTPAPAPKAPAVHQPPGSAPKAPAVHQPPGLAPKAPAVHHPPRSAPKAPAVHNPPGSAPKAPAVHQPSAWAPRTVPTPQIPAAAPRVSNPAPVRKPQVAPVAAPRSAVAPVAAPRSAYLAPPPRMSANAAAFQPAASRQPKLAPPPSAVNTQNFKTRSVTPSPKPSDVLLSFLKENKDCLKGSPEDFCRWLMDSEDITTLEFLAEAVEDDDYLQDVLLKGDGKVGIKGFKRNAFKKAAMASHKNGIKTTTTKKDFNDADAPHELICPISHELMTEDPVIAADGHTYERAHIEHWFRTQQKRIGDAQKEIAAGSDSQQARSFIAGGIKSPMGDAMPNLTLIPNVALRNMARDYAGGAN